MGAHQAVCGAWDSATWRRTPAGTIDDATGWVLVAERTFELIEPHVSLSGETSLIEKVRVARKTESEDNK